MLYRNCIVNVHVQPCITPLTMLIGNDVPDYVLLFSQENTPYFSMCSRTVPE